MRLSQIYTWLTLLDIQVPQCLAPVPITNSPPTFFFSNFQSQTRLHYQCFLLFSSVLAHQGKPHSSSPQTGTHLGLGHQDIWLKPRTVTERMNLAVLCFNHSWVCAQGSILSVLRGAGVVSEIKPKLIIYKESYLMLVLSLNPKEK